MDWCRHYNWQLLRLNPEYVQGYADFASALLAEFKTLFDEKSGHWEFDETSIDDHQRADEVRAEFYEFCAHWSLTHPVAPTKELLPKQVEFRVPEPVVALPVLAKDLAKNQQGVIEKLVAQSMPSLKSKRREPNKYLVLAVCDLRHFDKKNAADFVKQLQSLKAHYVPRQLKVRCDRSLLDRQITAYQMHREGLSYNEIAEAVQRSGEHFRNDRAAAYVTDVRKDIQRVEKLMETAPLIKFDLNS
jgi:hypothetical protein